MYNTKKFLGARIQEIRKEQGLKQSELAELVDIDSKHMSKIECGRCYPSFELLDKIAEKLSKPIADFLDTDHLNNRSELTEKLIIGLKNLSDEQFRVVYRILKQLI